MMDRKWTPNVAGLLLEVVVHRPGMQWRSKKTQGLIASGAHKPAEAGSISAAGPWLGWAIPLSRRLGFEPDKAEQLLRMRTQ